MQFKDRTYAGKELAIRLHKFKGEEAVVYALPRGGVVVAAEIAKAIGAPLDLIITRKIGHPYQNEMAIAAVSEDGHIIIDPSYKHLSKTGWFLEAVEKEEAEAKRRRETYLKDKKPISCSGKIALLVDDGIATGLTIKAAVKELKLHYHPKKIIIAVPVVPSEIVRELEADGVEVIALKIPEDFLGAVGSYYQSFPAVSDEKVISLLKTTNTF